jgi:thiamine pyrophosphate-dependent acetolactate synthase large subunit-like protein
MAARLRPRPTGKAGVCMATSGPGATNLVTAIADALHGQHPADLPSPARSTSSSSAARAFQETDFYGMTLPIVKHSFLVLDYNELPSIMYKAFKIATTGRPGPVVIDIPKDIQQHEWVPVFPKNPDDVSILAADASAGAGRRARRRSCASSRPPSARDLHRRRHPRRRRPQGAARASPKPPASPSPPR